MKKQSNVKKVSQWLSRRSMFFITVLLLGVAILLFWFLAAGFSPTNERITIGIAAVTAFLAAISAIATLLQSVEVQKQRENLERPYVIAYFDSSSSGALNFIIQNSGNSPALDVCLEFDPPPIDFADRPLNEVSLFLNPISFLPAGKVIRQIINVGYKFLEEGKPTKFNVTVKYSSIFGDTWSESIDHDLEYLKQSTLPSKTAEDYLKKISEEIGDLTQLVKSAQRSNPFLVETLDEYSSRLDKSLSGKDDISGFRKLLEIIFSWVVSKIGGG